MLKRSPWIEIPAFVAVALSSALLSNAVAGPRRRLDWFPAAIPAPPLAAIPAPQPKTGMVSPPAVEKRAKATSRLPAPPPSRNAPQDSTAELFLRFPPEPTQPIRDLGSEDAKWLFDHGALFLDARRAEAFEAGHIAGARSLPVWEEGAAEKVARVQASTADLSLPVVVYCAGGDCHDSHLLAEKLWLAGFRTLLTYTGGFPDWEARGRPVTKGLAP